LSESGALGLKELGSNADAPNLPLWTRMAALSPVLNNLQSSPARPRLPLHAQA